ncbi:MAG: chemotaxis-specific protein-glutamate methyltransferase CheB [Clostridiales bacterium]|nr:chemotaxis-specific protein-glutamate methyltransferase CheB [Clostridiales bacterium]
MKDIKILIFSETNEFLLFMMRKSTKNSGLNAVGHASKTENIIKLKNLLNPDVIIADIKMPVDRGFAALKKIKADENNIPIIAVLPFDCNKDVLSNLNIEKIINKPENVNGNYEDSFFDEMVETVALTLKEHNKNADVTVTVNKTEKANAAEKNEVFSDKVDAFVEKSEKSDINASLKNKKATSTIIAIGASTGGTDAILKVVKNLPEDTPGIVITQHMPSGFTKLFSNRLDTNCNMRAKEAQNGDLIRQGVIYVAPGGLQMEIEEKGNKFYIKCFEGEKVNGHCPSVEVLFNSVAEVAGENAIGVILTGMGDDGARGLLNMKNAGARTIGQTEETCVVYGMPKVAYNIGAVEKQFAVEKIGEAIVSLVK